MTSCAEGSDGHHIQGTEGRVSDGIGLCFTRGYNCYWLVLGALLEPDAQYEQSWGGDEEVAEGLSVGS